MEEGKGWIKLHRKIQDHWIWQEKRKFSKAEAWIDLLMMVNHEDKKVPLGNELILVKRGQRITSIRQLCDRWGWSNTKVTQFLKMMQTDGMLTVKSDTKKTVIAIENYDVYQSRKDEKTTENSHEDDTKQTQKHTNKNDKNDKNEQEIKDNTPKSTKTKTENLCSKEDIESFVESLMASNPLGVNRKLLVSYIDCLRLTRKTARISTNIVTNLWQKWKQYDPDVVSFAMWEHTDRHDDKREEYTLGIMRRTDVHEARRKLIIKKNKAEGGYNNAITSERGTQGAKDTGGKESFITSSYYDQFEGLFGEGG